MSTAPAHGRAEGTSPLLILGKLAAIAAFFAVWTCLYRLTNEWGANPVRAIHLVRPCDLWPSVIQPWTAVIYVFGGVLMPLLPFLYHWRASGVPRVLTSYAVASAIAFSLYALIPICIIRPSYESGGLGSFLMRGVLSVDNEANCCPSFHTIFAVLCAIFVFRSCAPRMVRWATLVLATAVCATTITTGQHYVIDVLSGAVTAVVSYFLATRTVGFAAGGGSNRPAIVQRQPEGATDPVLPPALK